MKQWKLQLDRLAPYSIPYSSLFLISYPVVRLFNRNGWGCSNLLLLLLFATIIEFPPMNIPKGIFFLWHYFSIKFNQQLFWSHIFFSFRCKWLNLRCVHSFRKIKTRNIDCVISFSNFIDIVFFFLSWNWKCGKILHFSQHRTQNRNWLAILCINDGGK